jgi:hypothetical protein
MHSWCLGYTNTTICLGSAILHSPSAFVGFAMGYLFRGVPAGKSAECAAVSQHPQSVKPSLQQCARCLREPDVHVPRFLSSTSRANKLCNLHIIHKAMCIALMQWCQRSGSMQSGRAAQAGQEEGADAPPAPAPVQRHHVYNNSQPSF